MAFSAADGHLLWEAAAAGSGTVVAVGDIVVNGDTAVVWATM